MEPREINGPKAEENGLQKKNARRTGKSGDRSHTGGTRKRKSPEDSSIPSGTQSLAKRRRRKNLETSTAIINENDISGVKDDDSAPLILSMNKGAAKLLKHRVKNDCREKSSFISSFLQPGLNVGENRDGSKQGDLKTFDGLSFTKSQRSQRRKKSSNGRQVLATKIFSSSVKEQSASGLEGPSIADSTALIPKDPSNQFSSGKGGRVSSNQRARRNRSARRRSVVVSTPQYAGNFPPSETGSRLSNGVSSEQEDSLEQDAARTLFSRFSSQGDVSPYFSKHSADDVGSILTDKSSIPQESSGSGSRKPAVRRRFREIRLSQTDPFQLIGKRIKVFWPLDDKWYYGWIRHYDPINQLHNVYYDDRQEEWLSLENEKFKLQFVLSKIRGRPKGSTKGSREDVDERLVTAPQPVVADPSIRKSLPALQNGLSVSRNGNVPFHTSLSVDADKIEHNDSTKHETYNPSANKRILNVYVRRRFQKTNAESESANQNIRRKPQKKLQSSSSANAISMNSRRTNSGLVMADNEFSKFCHGEFKSDGLSIESSSVVLQEDERSAKSAMISERELSEADVLPETDASASGLEHLSRGKLSGFNLPKVSMVEYQPLGGFLFIAFMRLQKQFLLPAFTIRDFIFYKDLRILPSLYPGLDSFIYYKKMIERVCGTLTCVWPDVVLDITLMDNLPFSTKMSVECSLSHVVDGIIRILLCSMNLSGKLFSWSSLGLRKCKDLRTTIPSIAVRVSASQALSKQYGFMLHAFSLDKRSWRSLKRRLGRICFWLDYSLSVCPNARGFVAQSSRISELISDLLSASSWQRLTTVLEGSSRQTIQHPLGEQNASLFSHCGRKAIALDFQSSLDQKMGSKLCFPLWKESGNIITSFHTQCSENYWTVRLKFAAAPKFSLEINCEPLPRKCVELAPTENHLMAEDSDDSKNNKVKDHSRIASFTMKDGKMSEENEINVDASGSHFDDLSSYKDAFMPSSPTKWLISSNTEVEFDAFPVSTADGWVMSSRPSYSEPNVDGAAAGSLPSQNHETLGYVVPEGSVLKLRKCAKRNGSWRLSGTSRSNLGLDSSVHSFEAGNYSHTCTANGRVRGAKFRAYNFAKQFDSELSLWNQKIDSSIPQLEAHNDKLQSFHLASMSPRKRGLGYSNLIFSKNSRHSSLRQKGYGRRGRPSRQQREENLRRSLQNSSNFSTYSETQSCGVNILVRTPGGSWREDGAHVVIEGSDKNEWLLTVKMSEVTRFTYKPQQFVPTASIDRDTHAMIWRGSEEWTLEFPNRKQWILFKDLYQECYNRNLRAASVRHIPIPGVREIEDFDYGTDIRFSRPASRYIRQTENEVEMALSTSRITYDMDSEDEEWLCQLNNNRFDDGEGLLTEVSEETFERIMDLLEKAAFTQQRELLNSDEVADFCWDIAPVEVVKAIHAHWQEKRWRKGLALVRQFQPACWERYQRQLKEWESQMQELRNSPNFDKHQQMPEKPPMFAFCLKPKGLELPNKAQKHKAHRKFNVSQHLNSRDSPAFKKQDYTSIGDESSSEAAGYPQSSSSSHMDTFSQSLDDKAGYSEPLPQQESMESRLKIHSIWKRKERGNPVNRRANKLRHNAPLCIMPNGHVLQSDLDERKEHSFQGFDGSNAKVSQHAWPSVSGANATGATTLPNFEADLRIQEDTNAAESSTEIATFKRAKAQRLALKADLSAYRAALALSRAEAIQACEKCGVKASVAFSENNIFDDPHDSYMHKAGGPSVPSTTIFNASSATNNVAEPFLREQGHWPASACDRFTSVAELSNFQTTGSTTAASMSRTGYRFSKLQADSMLTP